MKLFVCMGSLHAFLAVALGAFGAHGLKGKLTQEMLAVFQTGVQYHMNHALGLILVGLLVQLGPDAAGLKAAGWLLSAGIVLFSGSLYLLSISGVRWLGMITPLGGVAFLAGWALLALTVFRSWR